MPVPMSFASDVDWANSLLVPNVDNFCESKRQVKVVNPKRLLLWLLDRMGINDAAMDLNADGDTLYLEKVALISDEVALDQCIEQGRCTVSEQVKLDNVKDILASLWSSADSNPFKTQFLPGREGSDSVIDMTSFFTPEIGLETRCPAKVSVIVEGDAFSKELDQQLIIKRAEKKRKWYEGLFLRETSDDITVPFSEASPASFSLEGNHLNNTREVDAEFAVAYLLDESIYQKRSSQYYLYTQFDTDVVNFKGKQTRSSRNAMSLGLIAEYKLGKFDNPVFANNIVSFRPSYTNHMIQGSRLVNFIATWTPIPDLEDDNFVLNLVPISESLNFKLNGEFRLESGRVLENGEDEIFDGNNGYFDLGYDVSMLFTGRKNTLLESFKWSTHYKKLHATISDQSDKEYINSTLRYHLNQHFNIGLEYEKGRKGIQFNAVDTWEINLGAKY